MIDDTTKKKLSGVNFGIFGGFNLQ